MNTHDIDQLIDKIEASAPMDIAGRSKHIHDLRAAIEADRKRRGEPVGWLYEDELPDNYPYDTMFPYSKVDGVRMFPVYAPQPAEPVLDAPAKVGGTRFGKGIKWSTVIAAAQRRYAYEVTPTKEQERIKRATEFVQSLQYEGDRPAEPVKVPSDAESWLGEAIEEVVIAALEEGMCGKAMGDTPLTDSAKAGAMQRVRALLARYGKSTHPTFKLGDRVRKIKGSNWKGRVVGTYSTTLTPEGYAVESETETGSVQIYPVAALELMPNDKSLGGKE